MLVSDTHIRKYLGDGELRVSPLADNAIQPASVDLRLGHGFQEFDTSCNYFIDPERVRPGSMNRSDGDTFILYPGKFALATTLETVKIPDFLAGRLEGKSSLGRLGLQTHSTAGFIDPGFRGQITLELFNGAPQPIKLRSGIKIGQLCLFHLTSPAERPYGSPGLGSKYQGQEGPTPSRYHDQ